MSKNEQTKFIKHKLRHYKLHRYLDELVADFIGHTEKLPSSTTLTELMAWSCRETIKPTEKD